MVEFSPEVASSLFTIESSPARSVREILPLAGSSNRDLLGNHRIRAIKDYLSRKGIQVDKGSSLGRLLEGELEPAS
jgi:hypothetical protein